MLRRLDAGFAVTGDVQFLPGYSVLLTDEPDVQRLSDLPRVKRLAFLADMERLCEAVEGSAARLGDRFGHAAGRAGVFMTVSYSTGVSRPSAVCRRRRW